MRKKILKTILFVIILLLGLFFFYFNNTRLANPKTVLFYNQLKDTLSLKGYSAALLVISTKRFKWHNNFQVKFSGAALKSQHLTGDAIDFIVFDINKDGKRDSSDVNIVYDILDKKIIKDDGGIGTYKNERGFFNKQMIHIDCRGHRARWHR